ncbi:enoyl-CoA hydratase-related protein [Actinomadura bangladeshensis]|uniref:Enoyl-CoA hydratase n=1 Tax=Actinomadura bangladeshensis TaxID=453573 RepID=A0A4R4NSI5_9ACTN|nr:enoyl-CoA hydratase-related protein [Actinomadura bangladeshensis]TDC11924.1 enoyl-CoA hydratase [Actinomadura bangladeshensis]
MSLLTVTVRHGFDALVIDSPRNRNALSVELLHRLVDAVRDSAEGSSRGLVVTHEGPAFCSGVDLKERRADTSGSAHSVLLGELLCELWSYPRPVVTAVDGAVRGGGLGLLACSDLVLASPASTFAYSEARVGVAPALVLAVTRPQLAVRLLVPHLLSGTAFGAAEAAALGLVTTVTPGPSGDVLDAALRELAQGGPRAQTVIKRLVRQWAEPELPGRVEEMQALSADLFASAEAAEGMAAFAERRPPAWVDDLR